MAEMKDKREPKGCWATGNYSNTCSCCGKVFLGNKYARQCAPCAYGDITDTPDIIISVNQLQHECHDYAVKAGWWTDLETGKSIIDTRNKGEQICLMHSELSECMEGVRKNLMDDKLPHRKMEEVELADLLIRVFDYGGAYELDIIGALFEKLAYNKERADHKIENRLKTNGKKF